jgi:hypothetical protein
VKSLGADQVIDYTKEDFSASEARYDAIIDAVGKCPKTQAVKVLKPNGKFVTVAQLSTKQSLEEFTFIKGLIEAGKLKAVIDRCYPLEDVAEAHRYVETGRKAGNVVIQVGEKSPENSEMLNRNGPDNAAGQPTIYQIRIKGHLSRQRADWFEELSITLEDNGETLLTGPVVDQAALHGILKRIRDLGIPLLSVNSVAVRPHTLLEDE